MIFAPPPASLNRRAICGLEISLSYAKPLTVKTTNAVEADLLGPALSIDGSSSPSLSERTALPATLMPEFVPGTGADTESTMPQASSGPPPLDHHHDTPRAAGAWSRGDSPSRSRLEGGEGVHAEAAIPHDSLAPHESMGSSTGSYLPFDYSGESPSRGGYTGSGSSAGVPNRRLHFSVSMPLVGASLLCSCLPFNAAPSARL